MMTCTACRSPNRHELELAMVAGVSERTIAKRFFLSKTAVHRHAAGHLPARLARALDAEAEASAGDLLAELRALRIKALEDAERAEAIYASAAAFPISTDEEVSDRKRVLALKALEVKGRAEERAARVVALHARIRGELDSRQSAEDEKASQAGQDSARQDMRDFVIRVVQDPEAFAAARKLQAIKDAVELQNHATTLTARP